MFKGSRKLLITGFMGAGKTTIAAALSRHLGIEMLDLDHYIAEREGLTPQEIIDTAGEMRFREVETLALAAALKHEEAGIIALGGGTWIIGQNRALISEHNGFVIWLNAPFEMCWRRIAPTSKLRPLARDREKAHLRYEERRPVYQLASLHVSIPEGKRVDKIAEEIAAALRQLETEDAENEANQKDESQI